ncbi:efflux RND transporter periplasmic adaptor subunit [Magnetococcales bacterium HHB-1]
MVKRRAFFGTLMGVFLSLFVFTVHAEQVRVSGITEPLHDVLVGNVDTGVIDKIHVKEGDRVKKGETLFSLDYGLEELDIKRRRIIMNDKSELSSAQARAKTLRRIYKLNRELYESTRSVGKEELDKLELELIQAKADQKRLTQAEKRERVEFSIAKEMLRRKTVKASMDGIIAQLFLSPGEIYEPPKPILRVVVASPCIFVSNIAEKWGRRLKINDEVTLNIQAGERTIKKQGKIIFIAPVVDPSSGLMKVKVEFPNEDNQVIPGVSGTMLLTM